MKKKLTLTGLSVFLILGSVLYSYNLDVVRAAPLAGEKTLVLYDATTGAIPSAPLMNFTDFPPETAPQTYSDGVTVLDTTISGRGTYAGWASNEAITPGFPILDRTSGIQVDFTIQIDNETHSTNHRSGFNLIVLGDDAKGIELAFWENEIWVQNDSSTGGLFEHGEGVTFPTTTGLIDYQLTITGESYTLSTNSQSILSGPIRDYSEFDGFPDPYEIPNFLFLGDNTTSAQARVQLSFLSITGTEPVMPTVTSTSTSTSNPLPTDSPTLLPSSTPMPSPTPTSIVPVVCPSSGLILVGMIISFMMFIYVRKIQV